jgi:small subunit ribosomal protein S4
MARQTGPVCRLCRREKEKLFLKGQRCNTAKCGVMVREYPPGARARFTPKASDYQVRLREKQKARRMYGLMERQLRNYFQKADRQKGPTGVNLLVLLERRLDNVIYRLGFAAGRVQARQLVCHGHFRVNGRKVDIPSYLVKAGDEIELKPRSSELAVIKGAVEIAGQGSAPEWLQSDLKNLKGKVIRMPERGEMPDIQEQYIVELYSK